MVARKKKDNGFTPSLEPLVASRTDLLDRLAHYDNRDTVRGDLPSREAHGPSDASRARRHGLQDRLLVRSLRRAA